MKRIVVRILTGMIYIWGCIWYDKKYLKGKLFDRNHYTIGWKWIMKYWFTQKVVGNNREVKFPVHDKTTFGNPANIVFNNDDMASLHSKGCYFQALKAKLILGKGIKIAPNCGFITTNHDINDLSTWSEGKEIVIGDDCWIGMNSIILPGVHLGNHTMVGAGSIVTKSFEHGNVIIAGNPAKIIRELN